MYSAHNSVLLWCMVSPCAHGYVLRWSVWLCSMPSKSLQSTGQYTTTSGDCWLKWDKTCTANERVGILGLNINKASRDA